MTKEALTSACATCPHEHRKYEARDNGLWDSKPDDSGPHPDDVMRFQKEEDCAVLDFLCDEARAIVMANK